MKLWIYALILLYYSFVMSAWIYVVFILDFSGWWTIAFVLFGAIEFNLKTKEKP